MNIRVPKGGSVMESSDDFDIFCAWIKNPLDTTSYSSHCCDNQFCARVVKLHASLALPQVHDTKFGFLPWDFLNVIAEDAHRKLHIVIND